MYSIFLGVVIALGFAKCCFCPTWGETVPANKQEYPHFTDDFSDKMPNTDVW